MSKYYGVMMPDSQWEGMSPDQKLQYLKTSGGPSGQFFQQMDQQGAGGKGNYWDYVYGSVLSGKPVTHGAYVPMAKSGIGMMSGDAAADIGNAHADTTLDYGSDPRNDYIPRQLTAALYDKNASQQDFDAARGVLAKQQAREAEWMGHMGERLGSNLGREGDNAAFRPMHDGSGNPVGEWAAIEGYDPSTGQFRWNPRRRR